MSFFHFQRNVGGAANLAIGSKSVKAGEEGKSKGVAMGGDVGGGEGEEGGAVGEGGAAGAGVEEAWR